MRKITQMNNRVAGAAFESLDPDALKNLVRDALAGMKMPDRKGFIQSLAREMKRVNLNMRAYLIPLGIPARSPEEMTPIEMGHLIRFLKMFVPQAMPAVKRVAARYALFAENEDHSSDPLAA